MLKIFRQINTCEIKSDNFEIKQIVIKYIYYINKILSFKMKISTEGLHGRLDTG